MDGFSELEGIQKRHHYKSNQFKGIDMLSYQQRSFSQCRTKTSIMVSAVCLLFDFIHGLMPYGNSGDRGSTNFQDRNGKRQRVPLSKLHIDLCQPVRDN